MTDNDTKFDLEYIENLYREMVEDSTIDREHIVNYAITLPLIHSKWICKLAETRVEKITLESKLHRIMNDQRIYYSGKSSLEVYKNNPFPTELKGVKLSKSEIDVIINADPKVIAIREDYDIACMLVDTMTSFMYQLGKNTSLIKTIHDAERMDSMIGS